LIHGVVPEQHLIELFSVYFMKPFRFTEPVVNHCSLFFLRKERNGKEEKEKETD
jgi:hypothetical protein